MRACPSGLALAGGAQQAEAGAGQFCFEAAAEVVLVDAVLDVNDAAVERDRIERRHRLARDPAAQRF